MSLTINLPDKVIAGLHQSYTLVSDEGAPSGNVHIEGQAISHRVIPLGPPKEAKETTTPLYKYKVTFLLPRESSGKTLVLEFQAGSSKAAESKPITES